MAFVLALGLLFTYSVAMLPGHIYLPYANIWICHVKP